MYVGRHQVDKEELQYPQYMNASEETFSVDMEDMDIAEHHSIGRNQYKTWEELDV